MAYLNVTVSSRLLTLHPRGAEALASEENCMVVVLGVIKVTFLLHKGPAAHILQAPRWVSSFNEADGLTGKSEKEIEMLTDEPCSRVNEHVSILAAAQNCIDW